MNLSAWVYTQDKIITHVAMPQRHVVTCSVTSRVEFDGAQPLFFRPHRRETVYIQDKIITHVAVTQRHVATCGVDEKTRAALDQTRRGTVNTFPSWFSTTVKKHPAALDIALDDATRAFPRGTALYCTFVIITNTVLLLCLTLNRNLRTSHSAHMYLLFAAPPPPPPSQACRTRCGTAGCC